MTATAADPALRHLAAELGVQTSYRDTRGRQPRASVDALLAVIGALGVPLRGPSHAPKALAEVRRQRDRRLVEPVLVAWNGRRRTPIGVRAPAGRPARARLSREDGEVLDIDLDHTGRTDAGGQTVDELAVRLPPGALPFGYHHLEITAGRRRQNALVISAPVRSHEHHPARRGVVAPVPSLHSTRGSVSGTYSDLADLGEWVASHGGDLVGTLPVLAAVGDEPSPYSPSSRVLWDERRIDPETMVEETAARGEAGASIAPQHPLVGDYARFRAAGEQHGPDWRAWPGDVVDDVRQGKAIDTDVEDRLVHLQHQAASQLASVRDRLADRGVGLSLDLPVGVHPLGFDCFRWPELFATGVCVGAPPDALFEHGQNWGFPPVSPEASRADGHAYFRAVLAHHLAASDLLRIDHVMGFHRQFWVPEGLPPTEGVYVRQPADELWAIACLESHRHRASLLGENLGTVPTAVDRALRRHRAAGMWVLPFCLGDDPRAPVAPVDEGDVATLGTHDMPTFAGFWTGRDLDELVDLGLSTPDAAQDTRRQRDGRRLTLSRHLAHLGLVSTPDTGDDPPLGALLDGMLGWLHQTEAAAVLVPLEDLWLETEQQNVPGTTTDHRPNWQRPMRHPVDRLDETEAARRLELLTGGAPTEGGDRLMARAKETRSDAPAGQSADSNADPVSRLTDDDLYLFNEGTHARLYEKLGAHHRVVDGTAGTSFAVWAPNAESVAVIGDFCDWDPAHHPLEVLGESGIWRGFIPGLEAGTTYKYRIRSRHAGFEVDKSDPFAFATEIPPATASRVADLSYDWGDDAWMKDRGARNGLDAPMSIYEVHLGSWKRVPEEGYRSLHYTEAATALADHVEQLGFTHVELVPIMEHPFFGSWGYQTTSYFAPSARHGSPTELMALIDALHQRNIGVILDWVPSHFPTDEHGLAYFDGTHLFEHDDPKQGYHPDWNSYIFNYGRHEVRSFLTSSALFWLDRYHVDGIRVDAVASMLYLDYSRAEGEWVPNVHGGRENLAAIEFLRRLNEQIYADFPDTQTIAEESTAWPMVSHPTYVGGLGFGMKWDMGWMHDTLEYFREDPVHRRYHHHQITFRMVYAFNENFVLPLSHDEAVHGKGSLIGKMPGDDWQRYANLRALYGYMHAQPGKKLLFMGAELAQPAEWDHDGSLDWRLLDDPRHRGVADWLGHLNRLHQTEPALHQLDHDGAGYEWVDANDAEQCVVSFLRWPVEGDPVLVVCNLTPVPRTSYRLGVPVSGEWIELANSDAAEYGGSGMGNLGRVSTTPFPSHGRESSLVLTLPPLSVLFLKPAP